MSKTAEMNKSLLVCGLMICISSSCAILRPMTFPEANKLVLLTFDDGPNADREVTKKLLDVLRKHNVKAVFNVIGRNVNRYPELVRETWTDGHIISNHGNTEWPLLLRGHTAVELEIDSCDAAIGRATGDTSFRAVYFRPSFGWYGPAVAHETKKRGLVYVGTTWYGLDDQKAKKKTGRVLSAMERSIRQSSGGVPTLHDGKAEYTHLEKRVKQGWLNYDRSMVPVITDSIIAQLSREGYRFPTLDELPKNDLTDNQKQSLRKVLYKQ